MSARAACASDSPECTKAAREFDEQRLYCEGVNARSDLHYQRTIGQPPTDLSVRIVNQGANPRTDQGSESGSAAPTYEDAVGRCTRDLATKPEFANLSRKLPLTDYSHITFAMLADDSKPTDAERRAIADWFDGHDSCVKQGQADRAGKWPPEILQLIQEGDSVVKAIGADLYNGKITYGEANKRITDAVNNFTAHLIPIVKQYQALVAEQRAAAQQTAAQQQAYANEQAAQQAYQDQLMRQHRTQLFLNYMSSLQEAQARQMQIFAPKPTYNTNCYTSGNSTNCTTH